MVRNSPYTLLSTVLSPHQSALFLHQLRFEGTQELPWTSLLPHLFPTSQVLTRLTVQDYYQCLTSLLHFPIPTPISQFFLYWRAVSACFLPNHSLLLSQIAQKAVYFHSSDPSFLQNPAFFSYLITETSLNPAIPLYRVTAYSLKTAIQSHPCFILTFTSALEQLTDLWRYSASIFTLILHLTGLNRINIDCFEGKFSGLIEKNRYLECISEYISGNFDSNFTVLLSDFLYFRFFSDEKPKIWLNSHLKLTFCLNFSQNSSKNLDFLIKVTLLRVILDKLVLYMHEFTYSDSCKSLYSQFNPEIMTNLDCKLYCWKGLKAVGRKYREVEELVGYREACRWLQWEEFKGNREISRVFRTENEEIARKLRKCLEKHGNFEKFVNNLKTETEKVAFLVTLMEETYCKHRQAPVSISPALITLLSTHQQTLFSCFGPELCSLIGHMTGNFPENSFLFLSPTTSDLQYHSNLGLVYVLIVVLVYREWESPLTSVLFTCTGEINLSLLSVLYPVGVSTNPLYEYLASLLHNWTAVTSDTWRTDYHSHFAQGSCYRCSTNCDYVYIVEDCAGVTQTGKCPFCDSNIGGNNYALVLRNGHENMTDSTAVAFISDAVETYRRREKPGFRRAALVSTSYVRGLHPPIHRWLHWCLHASIYGLMSVSGLDAHAVAQKLPLTDIDIQTYFHSTLSEDWRELTQSLSVPDSHYLIYALISRLPELIRTHKYSPTTPELRSQFETAVDTSLWPLLTHPERTINTYKKEGRETQGGLRDYVEEWEGLEMTPFPLWKLLRRTAKADFKALERAFRPEISPVIAFYISKKTSFDRLFLLKPLLALSNYLLRSCSFSIPHSEANSLSMSQLSAGDKELALLYSEFTAVWGLYAPKDLQDLVFNEMTLVRDLVPVNSEDSVLLSVLLPLISLHNQLLSAYDSSFPSPTLRPVVPVSVLSPVSLLSLSLDFSLPFSTNSPQYGLELGFDWNYLDEYLHHSFLPAVKIEVSNIRFVYFQGEIFTKNPEIIRDVKGKMSPERLGIEGEMMCNALKKKPVQANRRLLGLLEQCFSLILDSCYAENTVLSVCLSHILLPADISNYPQLTQIPLNTVLPLYEQVEITLFPSSFHPKSLPNPTISVTFLRNPTLFAHISDIKIALKRLFMRFEWEKEGIIGEFIGKRELWREEVDAKVVGRTCEGLKSAEIREIRGILREIDRLERENGEGKKKKRGFGVG